MSKLILTYKLKMSEIIKTQIADLCQKHIREHVTFYLLSLQILSFSIQINVNVPVP